MPSRVFFVALAISMTSCAWNELDRAREARQEYDECLASNPGDSTRCEQLRQETRAAQEVYEGEARRSWGCSDPAETCHPYEE
jgi:hypothetical protein